MASLQLDARIQDRPPASPDGRVRLSFAWRRVAALALNVGIWIAIFSA